MDERGPGAPASPPLEGLTPAQLLWVSDYVDAAQAAARAGAAEAFSQGRETGFDEGRRDYERQDNRRHWLMAEAYGPLARVQSYAQLDRKRWGPGGRPSAVIRRPAGSPAGGALVDGRSPEAGHDCTMTGCGWRISRAGVCRNGHTAADRIAASLEVARLRPDDGLWPKDLRRRARRRGDRDPFHIRHGPDMTCTACAYWGMSCPDEEET
jgi:hypothetical protein